MESSAQNLSGNRPDAAGKHFEVCETKKWKKVADAQQDAECCLRFITILCRKKGEELMFKY